jgi:hypothetical protein
MVSASSVPVNCSSRIRWASWVLVAPITTVIARPTAANAK